MNIKSIIAACLFLCGGTAMAADDFINLTPTPKEMSAADGSYTLPAGLKINISGLSEEMTAEAGKFIEALNAATSLGAQLSSGSGEVTVTANPALAAEGYNLDVTASGIAIEAATPQGLFYAFQTVKKLLPENVMAGVPENKTYSLPLVSIKDEPRSEYRGFMLDCSRHFFTVDEIKRMLTVMSYYKMNKFHWHLTDDQGWRIEMPEYPRLQTVGATAPNVQIVDMWTKTEYWLNKAYGPYYYTQDQMREIVAFAAALHIEVIPEVDMPGHFSAVMAAYPEFSCTPDGGHSVAVTGGIYSDVLNVANPAAMQFVYDVCDVLMDIFPSKTIHIGGDECPTNAWQNNAECQAKYAKENLTSYRQLQSLFIKDVADYIAKGDRHLGLWNESITENGADTEMVKSTGATIWCWVGADAAVDKAASLGLKAIYTPHSKTSDTKGSFYINRSQSPDDPPANGYKVDDVKSVYNTVPFTNSAVKNSPEYCYGVQGTFWCERVAYRQYLEYLALPRLLAIAEIGWTPQAKKNWTSFQKRMSADRKLLDYNGYLYSPYWMLDDGSESPEPDMSLQTPLKQGAFYVFENSSEAFRGAMLADGSNGTLVHSASPWQNTVWCAASVADNADKSQTVTLRNQVSGNWIAAAGDASGRLAKPVALNENGAELKLYRYSASSPDVMLSIGDDALWCVPADAVSAAGTVRAGANNGSGVSPFQGAAWQAVEVSPVNFTATDTDGKTIFTGTRGIPVGADAADFLPELKGYKPESHSIAPEGVTAVYSRTADYVTYIGRLENGIYVSIEEVEVPLGQEIAVKVPEVPGCTLLTAGTLETAADGTKTVTSIYSTTAHMGVKKALNQVTGAVEEGEAYLIRDAHSDRNAFRCETAAGTVSGAKIADNQSPMFTWILEANNSKFKVRNLATGNYVKALVRSTTAKTGATGGASFTFTWDENHWNIKGSNGMYWDGLDNLDLVGWDGGTGHPIEIYEFLGTPFYLVTVNHVDSHGSLLGTETKYAIPGETYVLGLPFRKGYSVTAVDGTDALKNLAGDATVTVTYTSDEETGITEIETGAQSAQGIYDLNGRRLQRITTPGIYIINGVKTHIR